MIDLITASSLLIFISMLLAVVTLVIILLVALMFAGRRYPSSRDIERVIDSVSKDRND